METSLQQDMNVATPNVAGCKEILLRKLSYAVICSVISQVIMLLIFLFIVNFDVFHPLNWLELTFSTLTSVSTWLFVLPFSSIIFAQSIVCAKDYVLTSNYSSTRIQKFLSVFSVRNLVLLILHVLIGALMVWLFLSLGGGQYESVTSECDSGSCLVEGSTFLILSGLWTGFYFFIKVYIAEKKILFPVIHQHKLLQFKSRFLSLINESKSAAVWPTLYFIMMYYVWEENIISTIVSILDVDSNVKVDGFAIYLYAWLFSVLYFVSMNLMRFFFELFLTEPVQFPIVRTSFDDLCLADAIGFSTIPIIQHLACMDLYILSQWCLNRRQDLFSLSLPGGHPHHWNYLMQNILKLTADYTGSLNKSTSAILYPESMKKPLPDVTAPVMSPVSPKHLQMRNMSMVQNDLYDIVDVSQTRRPLMPFDTEALSKKVTEKLNNGISIIKRKLGIDFLFGELPEANIQYCLGNAQIIMWTAQGLSQLAAASLEEDRFGIVQKDMPVIITSLVELKTSLEKLNRVPALNRKSVFDDFNSKMKVGVNASVKRSLFGICNTFGQYLKDFPLSKDVLHHLHTFVAHKTV